MANHHAFLFPILKVSIATTYGFPGMSEDDYLCKNEDGTLTQNEADDHNTPGPFSYLGYMQALLEDGFWGDELCLALISMMWQISITVVKGETFHQIKFRHSESLKNTIWSWCIAKDDITFQLVSLYFPYSHFIIIVYCKCSNPWE